MVELRPESASNATIRRVVDHALTDRSTEHVAQHHGSRTPVDWPDAELELAPSVALRPTVAFATKADRRYALDDFTRFQDSEFIVAAYRGILERPADPAGFAHYVQMFRQGVAKAEILGRLRYSAEGKRVNASVPTLRLRYPIAVASRLPVIGEILGLLELLGRANALKASIRRLEAHLSETVRTQTAQLAEVDASARRNAGVLEARVKALRDR